MGKIRNRIVSLFLVSALICTLLPTAVLAEELPPAEVETIVFDVGKGSVTANADGVTGVTGEEAAPAVSTTIAWENMNAYNIVVTGTSLSENHVEVAADCPQDVTLTLRGVDITTADDTKTYSAVCNKTDNKTLTLYLEGENILSAEAGRLLWTDGAPIQFAGQQDKNASLKLSSTASEISPMYSLNGRGTFVFENCQVTLNRRLDDGNASVSAGTTIRMGSGASITDSAHKTFSENAVGQIEIERNIADGDIIIGKGYQTAIGGGTLIYENINPTYMISGTSVENRITVTSPDAKVILKDLSIDLSDGTRSAFLIKYSDPADYSKLLAVRISGNVSLTADSASAFNTNESEKTGNCADVRVIGMTDKKCDKLTITRKQDSGILDKVALGANLTAENLTVIVMRDCKFNVTAGEGSTVYVDGTIAGKGAAEEDGQLIRGFGYKVKADGLEYIPVADKSNENMLTLLLPGNTDLSQVMLEGTPGWTAAYGEALYDASDVTLNFAEAADNTVALTVTPSAEVAALGGKEQTVQLRAMKGSEIPALYLEITDEEVTMADVNKDANHKTKALGKATLLGETEGDELVSKAMEVKGRGNASWARAKKGYQVKLDKKADVLGMGKSKKWVLLPSAADLSLLRNAVGLDLAEKMELDYTSDWRFVDFYVNGEYYGLYILCEKAEIGENRIDIANLDDVLEETIGKDELLSNQGNVSYSLDHSTATLADGTQIDLTGGYHLEFDNYDDDLQFMAGNIKNITVKEPECLGGIPMTDESFTYIRNFMAAADAAVLDTDSADFMNYIDMESFAKMWLLQEYVQGNDSTDNMHLWKDSDITGDGLLHAGPAWDFDNIMARDADFAKVAEKARNMRINENDGSLPEDGKYANYNAYWLIRLLKHPEFKEEIKRQYELYKDLFTCCDSCSCASAAVIEQLDCGSCPVCYVHRFTAEQENLVRDSMKMDTVRWYDYNFVSTSLNKPVRDFYRKQAAANIKLFACARNGYLKNRIDKWNIALNSVTFEDGNTTVGIIPVGSAGLQTLPEVKKAGYTFLGWFYTPEGGEETEFTCETPVTKPLTVTAKWALNDDLTVTANTVSVDKVYDGKETALSVTPSHKAEDVAYTYQWYKGDPAVPDSAAKLEGAADNVYNVKKTSDSGSYYCQVTATAADGQIVVKVSPKIIVNIRSGQTGGGGFSGYGISVEKTEYGTVKASCSHADSRETVVLTVSPEEGYELSSLAAAGAGGNAVDLTKKSDGKYTFIMPGFNVTVKAVFTEIQPEELPFADVPAGVWHENAVRYVYENGMMSGTGADAFSPERDTTRGMIAAILWRMEDSPAVNYRMTYDDVDQSAYYAEAIRWATSEGIVKGYGNGLFGPDDLITREQFAAILYRYAQHNGGGLADIGMFSPDFTDAGQISEYAREAMGWCIMNDIINGKGNGLLDPKGTASRAQAAQILMNYLENV